ncbi:probable nitrogen metabolic regulation protein nmr [Rhynchosporium secalis]|uniref:Probable nitrogen metabolic regulation protein nmr n=1 Tax=Rhynchosporium secalis TaxID=38038 RepID=A0A1E1MK89_RHYSE|nr:probable nitrogen metabolic regulation protein nmr [Rhynchosporium secalis]
MPSVARSALSIRPSPRPQPDVFHESSPPSTTNKLKHRPCTSYTDLSPLASIGFSPVQYPQTDRPSKRPMPTPRKTIAVVNSSGRQAASFIRVAVAVGYNVRAQLRNLDGIVANEISSLPNVTVLVGDLYKRAPVENGESDSPTLGTKAKGAPNHDLIKELYRGTQLAFINTTFWGDEVEIGKALADAAVVAGIEHYIFSSMPNHSQHDQHWPSLPLWSSKATIETYIRSLPALAPKTTYLYTGIYNNNFTSLPYPLFQMELQKDGSFTWTAPFHPDVPLPWLDAEHDVGPAVIQLIKDGISRWGNGERVALAYEMLSPRAACRAFSRGVGRPVRYKYNAKIDIKVKIPNGYREQLLALEKMYLLGAKDAKLQPPYFGSQLMENSCPSEALELWEGHRGLEEYAREVFPLEEAANGLTWMNDSNEVEGEVQGVEVEQTADNEDDETGSEGELVMGGGTGTDTPARREESWLA